MTGGRLAYAGKAADAIAYFERAGHAPPEQTNAADFIIDTLSVNHRSPDLEASSRSVTDKLYALHCQQHNADAALESAAADPKSQEPLGRVLPHYAGFLRASLILTRRNFTDTFRQRGRYIYRVVGPVTIVAIVCLLFWRIGNDLFSVFQWLGCILQFAGGSLPAVLVALDLYPRQREVAFREISNGSYSASAFFASYLLNEVPLTLVSSFFLTTIGIFIVGFKLTVETAFKGYVIWFCYITLGETMTLIFSTLILYGGLSFVTSAATV
ncbi:ATP-binding cassette sub- G member 5 [Mortierella alpina]|nr:ATP-binding cassette sub- G member 5 [Mortierella alpina]